MSARAVNGYVLLYVIVSVLVLWACAALTGAPRRLSRGNDGKTDPADTFGWVCLEPVDGAPCNVGGDAPTPRAADRALARHWHRDHWRPYLPAPVAPETREVAR